MALANQLGLTNKVVSERHYFASQTNLTAGHAAKLITKAVKKKISAKDVKQLYMIYFHNDMEWHHSGFYKGATGKTMGRTYFISLDETQDIIDNFDTLYPVLEEQKKSAEEDVCAFYWTWENQGSSRRPRWCKALKTYEGKRACLPKNSTVCERNVYEVAKKAEGRIYTGWSEPNISEFNNESVLKDNICITRK